MKTMVFLTALIFAFGSCPAAGDEGGRRDGKGVAEIDGNAEDLYGLEYAPDGLGFQVQSTGCTEKNHFRVMKYQESPTAIAKLLLVRTTPDFCDAYVPFGTWVFFGYRELDLEGGEHFTILNPNAMNVVRTEL